MPRPQRCIPACSVVHVINRGNDRQRLFDAKRDYDEFLKLLVRVKARAPIRILAYCLMPNHWHIVLWPESAAQVSRFLHRLCTTHAVRRRCATGTVGDGHLYQDRFHAFVIDSERRYFLTMRYVEANARRAGLVAVAERWRWSSLAERTGRSRGLLDDGPLALPDRWSDLVNHDLPTSFLEETRERFKHRRIPPGRARRRLAAGAPGAAGDRASAGPGPGTPNRRRRAR